jgi:hypothetical protein
MPILGGGQAGFEQLGADEHQHAHYLGAQSRGVLEVALDGCHAFLLREQAVLVALGVEEHVVADGLCAVLLHPAMPLVIEGVAEIREGRHHLLGQALDTQRADAGCGRDALLEAQFPEEVFLLEAVQADTPLDRVRALGHGLPPEIEFKF